MSSIRENIKISEEKMTYLFFNSFRGKYKLLTLGIYPDYYKNNDGEMYRKRKSKSSENKEKKSNKIIV